MRKERRKAAPAEDRQAEISGGADDDEEKSRDNRHLPYSSMALSGA